MHLPDERVAARARRRVLAERPSAIGLSAVTASELAYGARKSRNALAAEQRLQLLLSTYALVPYEAPAVSVYGEVRADLERRGTPIGPLDTLIAAHALSLGTILVTANVREFARVRGLSVENWTT